MSDADGHDPQSAAAQPTPSPPYTAYRLVVQSGRGPKYLLRQHHRAPRRGDLPGVGTRFGNTSAVQHHVRRELAGASCYDAVEIVDDDGRTVMRGVRSGFNGTGSTWIGLDVPPGDAPAPA